MFKGLDPSVLRKTEKVQSGVLEPGKACVRGAQNTGSQGKDEDLKAGLVLGEAGDKCEKTLESAGIPGLLTGVRLLAS